MKANLLVSTVLYLQLGAGVFFTVAMISAMQTAIQKALEQSGEKLSQKINVPGGKAFKYRADSTTIDMTPKGAVLKLRMSASIPSVMICEVRQTLQDMNNYRCVAGR